MELTLKKNKIPFFKKKADASTNHEETMEMIVPDSLPDIREVLDTDGTAVLRSKECDNGKMIVTGFVRANVVYVPDGGGISRGLSTQIPFTVTLDAPDVDCDSRILANSELSGIEARALNSRKLAIRAFLNVGASAYGESEFSRSPAPDEIPEDLELLTETCELNPVVDVSEKAFTISDEIPLPPGKPPISLIIKSNAALVADEFRVAGSKLILKGTANIVIVYASMGIAELSSAILSLPFSEVLDLSDSDGAENKTFDVTLTATSLYVQENGGDTATSVSIEISALAQAVVCKRFEASYIADAYSTSCEASCRTEESSVSSLESEQTFKETVRETLPTAVNPRSVICVRVFPNGIVRAADGYGAAFKVTVTYCSDDGQTLTTGGKLNAFFAYPDLPGIDDIRASATFGEPFAAPVAGGIEVRVPVELHTRIFRSIRVSPVYSVSLDEKQLTDYTQLPSLVLHRVTTDDTLWELAKRYNSTRELIREANELDSDSAVCGRMLIISKKRPSIK
ncbi:MAG: DUF3794 domain-containing protein [Oscillospiraceae bacterium]|nr:DUF3794 domain-containing protein [Oscillospiraceae bacterium]